MPKSNKSIAGYHLLMILSAVDEEFSPEEGIKITDYLAEEFPFRINLDDELDIIATLRPAEREAHFKTKAQDFLEDSTPAERQAFITFAKSLIKADDSVTDEEHHFYTLLKNIWDISQG